MSVQYYDTNAEAAYYRSRGLRRSASYAAKLRCWGKGPKHVWIHGKPYTTREWMDEDIESSASAPARSYAEHRRNQSSITRNAAGDESHTPRRAAGKADAAGMAP